MSDFDFVAAKCVMRPQPAAFLECIEQCFERQTFAIAWPELIFIPRCVDDTPDNPVFGSQGAICQRCHSDTIRHLALDV